MIKNKKIILVIILILLVVAIGLFFFHLNKKKIITIENNPGSEVKSENTEKQIEQTEKTGQAVPGESEDEEVIKKENENDLLNGQDKKEKDEEVTNNLKTKNYLVDWGFSSGRTQTIDTIVIHTVYNQLDEDRYNLDKILGIFENYGVAPHYIIDRAGKIYQLVAEKNTAYHAGESVMPDGRTGVNNFSIGIEIINAEDDELKNVQYESLERLTDEIKKRYKIKYVLGHSDIASGRKTDPWNFDWDKIGGKKK